MHEKDSNPCNLLLPYLAEECSVEENAVFEAHMASCSSCREQLAELQQVWAALPYQMEEVEVPSDLKSEVMNAIFPAEPMIVRKPKRRASWYYGAAAAVVLIVCFAFLWNGGTDKKDQWNASLEPLDQPAEVMDMYTLKTYDATMASAEGTAWLVRQGDIMKLIVSMKGLSPTKGNEAYQVWLIHGGKRWNCGTFRVDSQGNGIISYIIKSSNVTFDGIGVTLEPDPDGSQPRGKKVVGT